MSLANSRFFILFWVLLFWGYAAHAQTIRASYSRAPLKTVLLDLLHTHNLPLAFADDAIPDTLIYVDFVYLTPEQTLKKLLPAHGLRYEYRNGQYIILRDFISINGFVLEAGSREPLAGLVIQELESNHVVEANMYGYFSLPVMPGRSILSFQYFGNEVKRDTLLLSKQSQITFLLSPFVHLPQLQVDAVVGQPQSGSTIGSGVVPADSITLASLQSTGWPNLGLEPDIQQQLQRQPGVSISPDGIGGLFVRGSGHGHNATLIDGIPIYSPGHAAGLFSIIPPQSIRSTTFYTGHQPAYYQGGLGSVVDVRTKDGNNQFSEWQFSANSTAVSILAETPLAQDKAALMVVGRKSIINPFLRKQSAIYKALEGEKGATSFDFYDVLAKLHFRPSEKNQWYLTMYKGRDAFVNEGTREETLVTNNTAGSPDILRLYNRYYEQSNWGNTLAAFRWNRVLGDRLFINSTFHYSQLSLILEVDELDSLYRRQSNSVQTLRTRESASYDSGITSWGLRSDLYYQPRANLTINMGVDWAKRRFDPGAFLQFTTQEFNPEGVQIQSDPFENLDLNMYTDMEWNFWDRFRVQAGVRFSSIRDTGFTCRILQPRVQLEWKPLSLFTLSGSVNRNVQPIHLVGSTSLGLPTDLWIGYTQQTPPQEAWQYSLEALFQPSQAWHISANAWYKTMKGLITYADGANFFNDWRENITSGHGTARGVSARCMHAAGNYGFSFLYTLGQSDRVYDLVNQGNPFPFYYDRRHQVQTGVQVQLSKGLRLSGAWYYGTGAAYSSPAQSLETQTNGIPTFLLIYPEKNNARLPDFHRLDISVAIVWKSTYLAHEIQIGFYNAYNQNNPLYFDTKTEYSLVNGKLEATLRRVQATTIPFIPVVGYRFHWKAKTDE